MVKDCVIRVAGIGKQYRIGAKRVRFNTLRESLTAALTGSFRRLTTPGNGLDNNDRVETIWALKDVSFEVKEGEVLGVIGRNGSGKSTLLKILSRITEPTEGSAKIRGRVGSLLEVGTGFHSELTGRENIYLNGAILGMKKTEIVRKFDEIVAFAEVDKFIDTPVKHYSSGMYMRLAFAVAAHLEPGILLVDEVLAVGDAAFQRKCLGKMGEVAKEGRTVLFVSHQMNQIRRLSTSCLWLDEGGLRAYGQMVEVVGAYEALLFISPGGRKGGSTEDSGKRLPRFLRWEIQGEASGQPHTLSTMGPCVFTFVVELSRSIRNGHHGIALWNGEGQLIWAWAAGNLRMEAGMHELVHALPGLPLRPGVYHWQASLYEDGVMLDNWFGVPELIIATEPQTHPSEEWQGILNVPSDFKIKPVG